MNMYAGMDSQKNFILPGDLAFTSHHILTSQESSLAQLLTPLYCHLCPGLLKVLVNFVIWQPSRQEFYWYAAVFSYWKEQLIYKLPR